MREAAWRALVDGKDYRADAGARVLVLPDSATVAEMAAVFAGASSQHGNGAPPS